MRVNVGYICTNQTNMKWAIVLLPDVKTILLQSKCRYSLKTRERKALQM